MNKLELLVAKTDNTWHLVKFDDDNCDELAEIMDDDGVAILYWAQEKLAGDDVAFVGIYYMEDADYPLAANGADQQKE